MCGIYAQVTLPGVRSDIDMVTDSLQRLARMEYRGYDSFGVGYITHRNPSTIVTRKAVGSVSRALSDGWHGDQPETTVCLSHTRWATHGSVTETNAHPQLSYNGSVAVAHNGVISNEHALRERLRKCGVTFSSDTDTELIAHLVSWHISAGLSVLDSTIRAANEIEGPNAFVLISTADPFSLYGASTGAPLIAMAENGRAAISSDQIVFDETKVGIVHLEDGEVARVTGDNLQVYNCKSGRRQQLDARLKQFTSSQVPPELGNFPHWMLKEISETSKAVCAALAVPESDFLDTLDLDPTKVTRWIGAGSSYYVAQLGQYFLASFGGLPSLAVSSDQARYISVPRRDDTVIAISQSGETYDTVEACKSAIASGASITSITNVPDCSLERIATRRLRQGAGPEISVLATKSVTSQAVLVGRLVLEALARGDTTYNDAAVRVLEDLRMLPIKVDSLLENVGEVRSVATEFAAVNDWFFVGNGLLYPVACESALKYREVTYKHAEGIAAGFLKHGSLSLIDKRFHTLAFLPTSSSPEFARTQAAINEVNSRGGPVITFGPDDLTSSAMRGIVRHVKVPLGSDPVSNAVIHLVTGQLFAYFAAVELGRDVDQPRSLAKSTTVP